MSEPVCPRRGKWFGGCRFEPRYSVGAPTLTKLNYPFADEAVAIIEASKSRTYVTDVCVTCGRTIKQQESAA